MCIIHIYVYLHIYKYVHIHIVAVSSSVCCGVLDVCCRACSEQWVLQVVVQGVSLVSPGSTVCVLLVLQFVLQRVLECVLQGVATWCCVLQIRCCSVCCRVCRRV